MTDTGRVRRLNEDNFLIDEQRGLVMVADGMGGQMAGGIASVDALEAFRQHLAAARSLADDDLTIPATLAASLPRASTEHDVTALVRVLQALDFANRRLYSVNAANGHTQGDGMGTTLTGIWQHRPGQLVGFHIGDSRLYQYRAGELKCITRDQTVYQDAIDAGQTDSLPPRNVLSQAVGPTQDIAPAIYTIDIQSDDLYLLCSDGLHGETEEAAIAQVLSRARTEGLERCCADLIALANNAGGMDNITAVLTRCT